MKTILILALALLSTAADFRRSEINQLQWGNFRTTWLDDGRFPTATITVYFADGALRDGAREAGRTQAALDLLLSGTKKYDQRTLSEFFDFYGVDFSHHVTHEYATLSFTALVKDLPAVVDRLCHVVKEASYPREELVPHKKRAVSKLKNLPANHAALAERAFRSIIMKGSSYEQAVEGNLASLELLNSQGLAERWAQLRDEAPKRFYVKGPREALFVRDRFLSECGWKIGGTQSFRIKNPVSSMAHRIFLVPVPGANQAQIRVGRYIAAPEARDPDERLSFASDFLGGGFTARLIQEVRVKRGLTYSISSYVSLQAEYGRTGISTFSKNETVVETLKVIRDQLRQHATAEKIKAEDLAHMKNYVVGHYPFNFEGSAGFLNQLVQLDHVNEPVSALYDYPEKIRRLGAKEVAEGINRLFTWEELAIVVVGDPSLAGPLSALRKVELVKPEGLL